jgi:hypothetical protein
MCGVERYLDHDGCLALLETNIECGGNGFLRSTGVRNDLKELHLVDWRKVVHANDVLRPLATFSQCCNRNRRRVAGKHTMRGSHALHGLDHLGMQISKTKKNEYKKNLNQEWILMQSEIAVDIPCASVRFSQGRPQ